MSNPFAVASVQNRREIAHPRVLAKGKDDRRITEQTVLPQGLRISYIELVLVKRLNENAVVTQPPLYLFYGQEGVSDVF